MSLPPRLVVRADAFPTRLAPRLLGGSVRLDHPFPVPAWCRSFRHPPRAAKAERWPDGKGGHFYSERDDSPGSRVCSICTSFRLAAAGRGRSAKTVRDRPRSRQAGEVLRPRVCASQPRPAKPASIIAQVDGSGADDPTKSIDTKPAPELAPVIPNVSRAKLVTYE
jgi:hypothetical protein